MKSSGKLVLDNQKNYILLLIGALIILMTMACSGNGNKGLSENEIESYQIEILDSLVVDYLGMLSWSHISPDGQKFLALDLQKSDIILIEKEGKIIEILNKSGDQPESIGPNLMGRPQFRNDTEIALLGTKGLFLFDFKGNLKQQFKPDFDPIMNFIILNADVFQFRDPNFAIALMAGRNTEGSGFYESTVGTKFEAIDLNSRKYSGIIPFPDNSRFKVSEIFPVTNTVPVLRTNKEGLYIAFKNEPRIFFYNWENLNKPSKEIQLQIDNFQLIKGKDPKSVNQNMISFDTREFAYGAINQLIWVDGQLLVNCSSGLSDEEYERITNGISDFQEIFNLISEKNQSQWAVVSEDGNLIPVEIPNNLARIEFVDKEGNLWISPNRNEMERDYEVLFKARLR
ncbi:hypothetical protein [Cecembia rubra]|uniref:6-bladed beta-propeller protein n=1 Tax=Cecembia rubra TaxID=1485585 RepID=A0A2P8E7U9_9BACT|nr:hypothetical protein [Cecembia rubra]PSL05552.1 hypothetical protein CLV48_10362 [Cecembia rubra]